MGSSPPFFAPSGIEWYARCDYRRALPGVTSVQCNLLLRTAAITHDEQTSPQKLVRTLNWAALGARQVDGAHAGRSRLRRGRFGALAMRTLICAVLFGVSFSVWARPDDVDIYGDPFTYFAIACVAIGGPVLFIRTFNGLYYKRSLNMCGCTRPPSKNKCFVPSLRPITSITALLYVGLFLLLGGNLAFALPTCPHAAHISRLRSLIFRLVALTGLRRCCSLRPARSRWATGGKPRPSSSSSPSPSGCSSGARVISEHDRTQETPSESREPAS
eukprot:3337602-Pleurochrysis_carterae.AAC.2